MKCDAKKTHLVNNNKNKHAVQHHASLFLHLRYHILCLNLTNRTTDELSGGPTGQMFWARELSCPYKVRSGRPTPPPSKHSFCEDIGLSQRAMEI